METHYHDTNLSLKQVAEAVDRSPAYFSHLLTREYGGTFRELLTGIRIEKAKDLLATTDDSIQTISEATGFTNPNYFSRVFKAHTQQTPTSFRRN
nr:helix-turn-helix transcriptional regulator [Thalassobacillus sp. CUG 92003]